MFQVAVKVNNVKTLHSEFESYRDAVDQADMVRGTVWANDGKISDRECWSYAVNNQGFDGSFSEWQTMDDEERAEYDLGAAGIPTA